MKKLLLFACILIIIAGCDTATEQKESLKLSKKMSNKTAIRSTNHFYIDNSLPTITGTEAIEVLKAFLNPEENDSIDGMIDSTAFVTFRTEYVIEALELFYDYRNDLPSYISSLFDSNDYIALPEDYMTIIDLPQEDRRCVISVNGIPNFYNKETSISVFSHPTIEDMLNWSPQDLYNYIISLLGQTTPSGTPWEILNQVEEFILGGVTSKLSPYGIGLQRTDWRYLYYNNCDYPGFNSQTRDGGSEAGSDEPEQENLSTNDHYLYLWHRSEPYCNLLTEQLVGTGPMTIVKIAKYMGIEYIDNYPLDDNIANIANCINYVGCETYTTYYGNSNIISTPINNFVGFLSQDLGLNASTISLFESDEEDKWEEILSHVQGTCSFIVLYDIFNQSDYAIVLEMIDCYPNGSNYVSERALVLDPNRKNSQMFPKRYEKWKNLYNNPNLGYIVISE